VRSGDGDPCHKQGISGNNETTKHTHATSHPLVQSFGPGEDGLWCYVDQVMLESASSGGTRRRGPAPLRGGVRMPAPLRGGVRRRESGRDGAKRALATEERESEALLPAPRLCRGQS
jgi:hypothetical protein